MNARRRLLLAGAGLALAARGYAQPAGEQHLDAPHDLRPLLAQVRAQRAPLLLLFSTPGCPYCREVRRNYLAPRVEEQARLSSPTLLIREVDITSRAPLIDEQGRPRTQASYATDFGVRAVPVVVLLGGRAELLGEPLVGIDRSGFYEAFLARAIEQAQQQLK